MNFKTTYILFGVLAIILVALTITLFVGPSTTDTSKFVFPQPQRDQESDQHQDVNKVEIVRSKDGNLTFVRDDKTKQWKVNGFRADKNSVNNLIRQICEAQKTEFETPRSLADWGLDNPQMVVTLEASGQAAADTESRQCFPVRRRRRHLRHFLGAAEGPAGGVQIAASNHRF